MARLVNIGAGEVTDRLTILSLKILHGRAAGKPTDHFARERDVLLTQIRARTLNGSWFAQVLELAAVNAALWQAEEALRALRRDLQPGGAKDGNGWGDAGLLAVRIQDLNDQRAALVASINTHTGECDGAEKL
jgi:hypothetical protein